MLCRFLFASLLVLGTTATLVAQSNVSFELNADAYATGGGPVVTGDFNNDGKPDIVQCCGGGSNGTNADTLEFRAGNGDGTFQAPVAAASATGYTPSALVAADFNGDGNLDVAGLSGLGGSNLYVWFGNGDGTFQAPLVYTTTQAPFSLAAGNFFGDGREDIAVGESNGNIDLFKNQGSTFVFDESINLGAVSGTEVQLDAGDLNGTGVSDIAAAMAYGASVAPVYVLWNNGTGTFTQDELGTYMQPMVKMTRLNGDNLMDVLVGYTCDPTMNGGGGKGSEYNPCAGFDVYYGQGGNSLYKRTVVTDPDVYGPGTYEDLGEWGTDVNGDGYGDIVASTGSSCWCQFGLFVWQGNADGSFQQTAQEFISNTDSAGPVAAADFNRDGMMDFVVDQGSDEDAEIYLNATNRAACGTYTISPSVTVCQPVDDTYSPSPVTVQATSYDTTQVTAMQEYVDNQLEYSEPVTTFNTTFAESPGPHSFVTKGWDSSGRSFMADRMVTVYSGTPGAVCAAAPESASICVPSGTSSPVEIVANGDSGSVVPTAAQLYINGSLVVNNEGYCYQNGNCAGGTSSVRTTQNLASGSYTLLFKLWDANGDVYTAQKTITVE